jgi:hypothetical protein
MAGNWQKLIVAFLLLWMLADLSVPGLCQADDDRIDLSSGIHSLNSQASQVLLAVSTREPHNPSERSSDECVCCAPYPPSVFSGHTGLDTHRLFASNGAQALLTHFWLPTGSEDFLQESRRRPSDPLDTVKATLRC